MIGSRSRNLKPKRSAIAMILFGVLFLVVLVGQLGPREVKKPQAQKDKSTAKSAMQQTNEKEKMEKGSAEGRSSRKQQPHEEVVEHKSTTTAAPQNPKHSGAVVVLSFGAEVGRIRIELLPEHSASSVEAWKLASNPSNGAPACKGPLYRSEKNFLIQGRIDCAGVNAEAGKALKAIQVGACPPGAKPDPRRRCPAHDPHCGCHGPIMQPGMVGWAGGQSGPDFFILTQPNAADGWYYDDTVWGQIPKSDHTSWATIDKISNLPIKQNGIMKLLAKPLQWEFSSE